MGEYAIRKSDGAEVKIGTCEDMLYLRYEDRDKVQQKPGSLDPSKEAHMVRFRLPFDDEDNVPIGQYVNPFRGLRLYRPIRDAQGNITGHDDFTDPTTADDPGTIQLHHDCGLLANVPCYHGNKLPNLGDAKTFWNGKGWFLELSQLRPVKNPNGETQIYPVVKCRHCGHKWRYEWADVAEFIPEPMRTRLAVYMPAQANAA